MYNGLDEFHVAGDKPYLFSLPLDLDSITDDLEREATVGIIHNCQYLRMFRTDDIGIDSTRVLRCLGIT